MLLETQAIIHESLDFLPLKANPNIVEGDALRLDWAEVVDPSKLTYIIGNPPFVGSQLMDSVQKHALMEEMGASWNRSCELDFVAGWYKKTAEICSQYPVKAALVSTNSIVQGEQVSALWKPLMENYGIHIDFAWRTFRWDSEANSKAHVHCVIIGFSKTADTHIRKLFNGQSYTIGENINAYLTIGPSVFIESRKHPLCNVPQIRKGNQPTDGGHLILSIEEKESLLKSYPNCDKYIKKLVGAKEFLNNSPRYCLWLVGASPKELKSMPFVLERINKVSEVRLASSDSSTHKLAETPHLFREQNNPESFIIIPSHTSENRRYIPLGFLDKEYIATNAALIIPNANYYHFGILESNVHMAWMRAVCGRLKSDYRYSKDIVYNNFPWPKPTSEQKAKIEATAQAILDARALYPDCSLADIYDETLMPPELRKAHQANDRAVMEAYGLPIKTTTESSCVAHLFELYSKLTYQ